MAERVFWRSDTCCVWVGFDDDGRLVFTGQELSYLGESGHTYEYRVAVAPAEFPRLWAALGAAEPPADLVDLVCSRVDEIMARGERTWLDERGISCTFASH
jgi:hypothetical protein